MQIHTTILKFQNIHLHGDLFVKFFRGRHKTFVEGLGWDLPSHEGMEFDQYDTPQSCWVVLHAGDQVVAGFRMTKSTAQCGTYTYMLRDAKAGKLDTIPPSVLDAPAPVCDGLWECSRAFVNDDLPGTERNLARKAMIEAFLPSVQKVGGSKMITLTNRLWKRWMPMHGIKGTPLGPMTDIGGKPFQAVLMEPATDVRTWGQAA